MTGGVMSVTGLDGRTGAAAAGGAAGGGATEVTAGFAANIEFGNGR